MHGLNFLCLGLNKIALFLGQNGGILAPPCSCIEIDQNHVKRSRKKEAYTSMYGGEGEGREALLVSFLPTEWRKSFVTPSEKEEEEEEFHCRR